MIERPALGWLAIGAVLAIAWLASPVSIGILLGALLAFTLEPVYHRLVRRTRRPLAASLLTVMTTAAVIVGLLGEFVSVFITRAITLTNTVREELRPDGALTAQFKRDTTLGFVDVTADLRGKTPRRATSTHPHNAAYRTIQPKRGRAESPRACHGYGR